MSPKRKKLLLVELGTAFVAANAVFLFVRYQEKGKLAVSDWRAIMASCVITALMLGLIYGSFGLMLRKKKEPNQ